MLRVAHRNSVEVYKHVHIAANRLANTSIATCAELPSLGAGASCGEEATCTDVALPGAYAALTTAECSCTGNTFALATEESSAELLPYAYGCFTQRRAQSLTVAGVTTSSVIFRLRKTATANEVRGAYS